MGDLKIANGLVCCGLCLFFDQFEFFLHSMSITVIIIKGRKNWNWSHKEIRVNHNMHIIQKRLILYALIWKGILKSFIISHILMTFMFDLAVVLLGEVKYWSVLGLRGLKLFHAFCSWHVVSSNKYYWMTWCVKLLRIFFFKRE